MALDFAMIDAKDSELIGIHGCKPENLHNARIMGAARAEYLNKMLELQQHIDEKYGPQLIKNEPIVDEGSFDDVMDEYYKEMKKNLKPETDNLWYS